jgi:B12 binding domain
MNTRVNAPVDGPESGQVGAYLDLVASRDVGGARTLVLSELSVGDGGLARVIDELLVPAMSEVGTRWYDGRWNAAQEHVACGITESALHAASVRARSRR